MSSGQEVPPDGLVLWLKADAVTGVANGAAIANWPGSAGTPAASQPAVEHQPRWIADGLNGKPVVRFDGNDALVTPATIGLPRAHTLIAVVADRTTDDNGVFLWFEDDKGTPGPAFGSGAMGKSLRVRNYPGQAQTPLAPAAGLYSLIAGADGVHVYRNGINCWLKLENGWTGVFPGGGTGGRCVLGQHGGGVGQYLKGDMAELIAYGRAITPAERRGIEAYLIQKYRLPMATPKPAVLCIGNGDPYSYIATRLANDHGIQLGVCEFGDVTWEKLVQYNAVILFDMSRLNPDTRSDNAVEISPAGFQRVGDLLERFVQSGGGLYIYGVSFTHMGQGWANQTLNQFLQRFHGRVAFEMLHDASKESRQPEGQKVLYALADQIAAHPATAAVKNLWYAVGPFSYGPWTRPLILGPQWAPLIRTSPGFKATPIDPDKGWESALAGAVSEVKEPTAVIYAARTFGQGRVVLSGGESTISFFGYGYSPFADTAWGRIGMEKGLNGIPSGGLQLFASSLKWLTQPTVGLGDFGGYVVPPKPPFTPRNAQPMAWEPAKPVGGELKYYKGVFGAMPALGGGAGTVSEWVVAAKTQGLQYLVLCGDYEKMDKSAWEQLVAECKAASNDDFAATAALITRDDQNNRFLQCGSKLWPRELRLSKKNPKRVQDHLGYWMEDNNFACRAPFLFSRGQYPTWLHSGYDTFAVRTYDGQTLVEDHLPGFLQNQEQGDRSRIIVVSLLKSPAELAGVKEFTYLQNRDLITPQFGGGAMSYVSSGPRVQLWQIENAWRETYGVYYVPGTERWRARLKVSSAVPLKAITFYDSTRVWRRFLVSGTSAEITVDGLHDTRYVLTAVIEDIDGGQAVTGALETGDNLLLQIFCSDRCNIMNGMTRLRDAAGHEQTLPATNHLYKAGRLYFGTVIPGEGLPGIDGSGGGSQLGMQATFQLTAAEDGKSETRPVVHQINRPYENADMIIFDTPLLRRGTGETGEIYGHAPYVNLAEPKVAARLVQWHPYRNPALPAAVMGELSITVTDPGGVQLKNGFAGLSVHLGASPGWYKVFKRYLILRGESTASEVDGPAPDDAQDTSFNGRLHPGDLLLLPELGEGLFVLDGTADIALECTNVKNPLGLFWLGHAGTEKLAAGARISTKLLVVNLKTKGTDKDAILANWIRFRDQYGIAGQPPAYAVTATQGSVTKSRFLLDLAADKYGFQGTIGPANLPQRLSIKISGLNPKWTAAKVDLVRQQWFPLGVWDGAAYTTLDTTQGEHQLYLGNVLTCDNPDVWLSLLPANADGRTRVDVHNPTDQDVSVTVSMPVTTFLAARQSFTVAVPKGTTVRKELH